MGGGRPSCVVESSVSEVSCVGSDVPRERREERPKSRRLGPLGIQNRLVQFCRQFAHSENTKDVRSPPPRPLRETGLPRAAGQHSFMAVRPQLTTSTFVLYIWGPPSVTKCCLNTPSASVTSSSFQIHRPPPVVPHWLTNSQITGEMYGHGHCGGDGQWSPWVSGNCQC